MMGFQPAACSPRRRVALIAALALFGVVLVPAGASEPESAVAAGSCPVPSDDTHDPVAPDPDRLVAFDRAAMSSEVETATFALG